MMRTRFAETFAGCVALLAAMCPVCPADQPTASRVTVLVGSLLADEGGAAADAADGPLRSPFGVDFDRDGRMFVVELEGGRVLQRDADGTLSVIAGDGSKSYRGDGGPAAQATFNGMHNLAIIRTARSARSARPGRMFIADTWNHCVREIDLATRQITTVAGTGEAGFAGDEGPARQARFNYVMCVTLNAAEDALFIADLNNRRIRVLDLRAGTVRTVAGNGQRGVPSDGAPAADSPLVDPRAVAVDSAGRVYVLERGGHALRVVDADGRIRTVAGTGERGHRDGPAREAQFGAPKHLCVDDRDRVYIADDLNAAIRCYDPVSDTVATVLGRGHGDPRLRLKNPHGVCFERGTLYVVDTGHHRILEVELAR